MERTGIARLFVSALEGSDWVQFFRCLAPDCEYVFRGEVVNGAEAIVEMYKSIGEWVHSTFESVRYESSFVDIGEDSYHFFFRDLFDHEGHHLDFRCEQVIHVTPTGLIDRIEHFDLPGESEKAAAFNEACGVKRPGPEGDC